MYNVVYLVCESLLMLVLPIIIFAMMASTPVASPPVDTPEPESPKPHEGVLMLRWNAADLRNDVSLCPENVAWQQLGAAAHRLKKISTEIEAELMNSEVHCSSLWFSWGLLDLHALQLLEMLTTRRIDTLAPLLWALEKDFRDIIACVEAGPMEPDVNDHIGHVCVRHGRNALQRALQSLRTVLVMPRRKRSGVSILEPLKTARV